MTIFGNRGAIRRRFDTARGSGLRPHRRRDIVQRLRCQLPRWERRDVRKTTVKGGRWR